MSSEDDPLLINAKRLIADAEERTKFQHEYALAGFKTLILINGGAIIGLLTYAGHILNGAGARRLGIAFIWYVVGLASTTLSYLFAYLSQGKFMDHSTYYAFIQLGIAGDPEKAKQVADRASRVGTLCVYLGITFVLAGLACFVEGSFSAMAALIG